MRLRGLTLSTWTGRADGHRAIRIFRRLLEALGQRHRHPRREPEMVRGMAGSAGGYGTRTLDGDDLIQHSFWLFDAEEHARAAEATFVSLRDMPDAPATFVSADVCEVIGKT
jgi:hypothetical protein